ncbi:GNAT family N-acetyltransferase [Paenibacillus planticolens]|uniref:GNAT family N-acetyltransferase n=1 Tax=Paenibacillus planticolens TaxID=2654976 RepID=A0ABX1ZLV9_9BACL|nr:GNAT family N-acetyltransferase [Paenibacillus planticolens]NOV01064.1 GNAT family N-acetyltransferase [Paenibacillus planticolens]
MSTIREMTIEDYEKSFLLWSQIEGLVLSDADSKPNIESYLHRNKGFCFVCEAEDKIIGTILAGHDGRRGFIYHLAVNPNYRKQSIGQRLVDSSLSQLRELGIEKCHIFVLENNDVGHSFWTAAGWEKRSGFFVYSKTP